MSNDIEFNADEQRYEIHVDGTLAGFIRARVTDDTVDLFHTEVFDEFEGQGLAGQLATAALDDVREQGKKVIATCPYIASYISKHDEYADLLV